MIKTVFVAILAAILGFILNNSETPITGKRIKLGTPGYDIVSLQAPAATGNMLDVLSFLLTKSWFGQPIRRFLLNDNKLHHIRDLAIQVTDLPPMYYPMKRLRKDQMPAEETQTMQKNDISYVLHNGFASTNNNEGQSRTVQEYAAYYRTPSEDGSHLPSAVIQKTLREIRKWESEGFVIFSSLNEQEVMEQARESDRRHQLGQPLSVFDGVPVAFKDMMDIKGHKAFDGRDIHNVDVPVSLNDDVIVRRFRDLGAIILGLTVMVEGGVSPLGYNSHFKGPFNPYSLNRYSGGSSSGSAVVVTSGLVPIAVGFDGGGSIRIPSTMSGIHGLATTFGRIPFNNHTESTMIKAGPMAASAQDAALAYAVMSAPEIGNFYTDLYDGGVHGPPQPSISEFPLIQDLSDVRIGIYPEWFDDSQPLIRARSYEVVEYLKSRGATVVEIEIPHLQILSMSHGIKISSEFAMAFDAIFYERPDFMEPNTRVVCGLGSTVTALEALAADKLRAWAFKYVTELYERERLTAIVNPTIGVEVPYLSESAKLRGESNTALSVSVIKHVFMANFLGLPAYSVPVGFQPALETEQDKSATLLPVGFHLQGIHWSEPQLLRIAHSIEQGFTRHHPSFTQARPLHYYDPFAAEKVCSAKSGDEQCA